MSTRAANPYRSETVRQALAHLTEEAAELATAGAKALRWGLDSVNPELPSDEQETNEQWVEREYRDVLEAFAEFVSLRANQDAEEDA